MFASHMPAELRRIRGYITMQRNMHPRLLEPPIWFMGAVSVKANLIFDRVTFQPDFRNPKSDVVCLDVAHLIKLSHYTWMLNLIQSFYQI